MSSLRLKPVSLICQYRGSYNPTDDADERLFSLSARHHPKGSGIPAKPAL